MKMAGWIIIGLFALFMLGASVAPKLINAQVALDSMVEIGWPPQYLLMIGIIELVCTILIIIPRTALFGAIVFMAVLGGALASHLRVGSPLFSHILFSIYLGTFMWVGLWLRDPKIRAVFPLLPR
jgi:hypothetical protein